MKNQKYKKNKKNQIKEIKYKSSYFDLDLFKMVRRVQRQSKKEKY